MVRNYDPDRPVPPEVVRRLLEHAIRAPSAGFSQGWGFLVLTEPADRARFWQATTPEARTPETTTPEASPPAAAGGATAPDVAAAGPAGEPPGWLAGMRRAPLIIVAHSCRQAYLDRYAEPDKARRLGAAAGSDERRWPIPYWHVDTGMAALLILLTAVDHGLGACFFGIPPERVAAYRAAFGVPERFTPVGAVTVGYPAPDRRSPSLRRGRRGLDEVVHYGRWGPAERSG